MTLVVSLDDEIAVKPKGYFNSWFLQPTCDEKYWACILFIKEHYTYKWTYDAWSTLQVTSACHTSHQYHTRPSYYESYGQSLKTGPSQ